MSTTTPLPLAGKSALVTRAARNIGAEIALPHSKKKQLPLLELLIAEVMARTAADLTGPHGNSAALYYHKLRTQSANKIAEAAPEFGMFECY